MTFLPDILGSLAFGGRALRALGERGAVGAGGAFFCAGLAAYGLVRRAVYADLPELIGRPSGGIGLLLDLNLVQAPAFLLAIVCLLVVLAVMALMMIVQPFAGIQPKRMLFEGRKAVDGYFTLRLRCRLGCRLFRLTLAV